MRFSHVPTHSVMVEILSQNFHFCEKEEPVAYNNTIHNIYFLFLTIISKTSIDLMELVVHGRMNIAIHGRLDV